MEDWKGALHHFYHYSSLLEHIDHVSHLEAVVRADLVVETGVVEVRDTRLGELDVGASAATVPTIEDSQRTGTRGNIST